MTLTYGFEANLSTLALDSSHVTAKNDTIDPNSLMLNPKLCYFWSGANNESARDLREGVGLNPEQTQAHQSCDKLLHSVAI